MRYSRYTCERPAVRLVLTALSRTSPRHVMRNAGWTRSRIEQSSLTIGFRSKEMAFGSGHVERR